MSRRKSGIYTTLVSKHMIPVAANMSNSHYAPSTISVQSTVHAGVEAVMGRWCYLILKPEETALLMTELMMHVPVDWLLNDPKFAAIAENIKKMAKILAVGESSK